MRGMECEGGRGEGKCPSKEKVEAITGVLKYFEVI